MTRTLKISAIALLGVIILWACGGEQGPKDVADKFLKAIKTGDKETATKYISKESAENFKKWTPTEKGDAAKIVIGDVTENDKHDEATVKYKDDGKDKELKMKKEDGQWKCIFDAGKGGGGGMEDATKSLENLGNMFGGDSTKTE